MSGIPPLAPDDRPFDTDEDAKPPFEFTRWWRILAIVMVVALVASLAIPIFNWYW